MRPARSSHVARVVVGVGVIAAAVAVSFACEGPASRPPEGPGTAWPCGYQGVECPDHMCCPRFHVCGHATAYGYFNRCEPGYCCADMVGAGSDAAPPHKVKARRSDEPPTD